MGTLLEDLTAIKAVEDKIKSNKVSQFAYTQHAYDNPLTEADGVADYDVDRDQNIPIGTPAVMKVNATVVAKGWRSQASSITRMLMNHFLGRCSYNLNIAHDNFVSMLATFMSHIGQANGVATLDANGRIPFSQLPESAMELKGEWNASTNVPSLQDNVGDNGDYYYVSVGGTQNLGSGSQVFLEGDRVCYFGTNGNGTWKRLRSGSVYTVNSHTPDANGNVNVSKSDVGLSNVANVGSTSSITEGSTDNFTSGGAYALRASLAGGVRTVNGNSPDGNGNVNVTKSGIGLGSVVNTGDSATPTENGTDKFTTGGAYVLKTGIDNVNSRIDDLHIPSTKNKLYGIQTAWITSGTVINYALSHSGTSGIITQISCTGTSSDTWYFMYSAGSMPESIKWRTTGGAWQEFTLISGVLDYPFYGFAWTSQYVTIEIMVTNTEVYYN